MLYHLSTNILSLSVAIPTSSRPIFSILYFIPTAESKISDWISKGAQPSESVYKIFHIAGFNNGGKIKPLILRLGTIFS